MVAEPNPIMEAREDFDICMEVGGTEAFAQWAIDYGEQVLDALASLTRELEAFRALCGEAAELYGSGGVFPINGEMSARLELAAQGVRLSRGQCGEDSTQP